jgi:hypothetical protein
MSKQVSSIRIIVTLVGLVSASYSSAAEQNINFADLKRPQAEAVKSYIIKGIASDGDRYISSFSGTDDHRSNAKNWRGNGSSGGGVRITSRSSRDKYTDYQLSNGKTIYTYNEYEKTSFRIMVSNVSGSGISGVASTSDKQSPYYWIIMACSRKDNFSGFALEAVQNIVDMCS